MAVAGEPLLIIQCVPVRNSFERGSTGKIAWWWIKLASQLTAAITTLAVAGHTARIRQILEQFFTGTSIAVD
jgi:hypothetical protein